MAKAPKSPAFEFVRDYLQTRKTKGSLPPVEDTDAWKQLFRTCQAAASKQGLQVVGIVWGRVRGVLGLAGPKDDSGAGGAATASAHAITNIVPTTPDANRQVPVRRRRATSSVAGGNAPVYAPPGDGGGNAMETLERLLAEIEASGSAAMEQFTVLRTTAALLRDQITNAANALSR